MRWQDFYMIKKLERRCRVALPGPPDGLRGHAIQYICIKVKDSEMQLIPAAMAMASL